MPSRKKSGCCCHVIALGNLETGWNILKQEISTYWYRSYTSKPRKWGIPAKRTAQPKPIMTEKHFKRRHSSDIQGRKHRDVYPMLFDPRPSKSHELDLESVVRLNQSIHKVNPAIPLLKMIPGADSIKLLDTTVGEVAYGSETIFDCLW